MNKNGSSPKLPKLDRIEEQEKLQTQSYIISHAG